MNEDYGFRDPDEYSFIGQVLYGDGARATIGFRNAAGKLVPEFKTPGAFDTGDILRFELSEHTGGVPEVRSILMEDNQPFTDSDVSTLEQYRAIADNYRFKGITMSANNNTIVAVVMSQNGGVSSFGLKNEHGRVVEAFEGKIDNAGVLDAFRFNVDPATGQADPFEQLDDDYCNSEISSIAEYQQMTS